MSDELPGPHHCIGVTRTVTDVVFRGLRAQCAAGGGNLSLEELDRFHVKIIESFSSGFDLFELKHERCMAASLSMAAPPFARNEILSTLLRACGEKSARGAFSFQVERLGMEWVEQLFGGLAHYVHHHIHTDIDASLITAYVDTATIPKMTLTIDELLKQESVRRILLECVTTVFEVHGAPDTIVKDVCDSVNSFVAGERGVEGPHACKVTEQQMSFFLTLLPRQLRAMINVLSLIEPVAEPSIAVF